MLLEVHDNLVSAELVNEVYDSIHQPVHKFSKKSKPGDRFAFCMSHISQERASKVK